VVIGDRQDQLSTKMIVECEYLAIATRGKIGTETARASGSSGVRSFGTRPRYVGAANSISSHQTSTGSSVFPSATRSGTLAWPACGSGSTPRGSRSLGCWMSEEEKAAYRLQEPPETRPTVARFTNPDEYEPQST
jgi:hypothetical protein